MSVEFDLKDLCQLLLWTTVFFFIYPPSFPPYLTASAVDFLVEKQDMRKQQVLNEFCKEPVL